MINLNEIDVIIQGAVSRKKVGRTGMGETEAVIASLREHLPGAALILSTWKGTDVSGLNVDQVVLSDDPGSFPYGNDETFRNNVNRQIVSTRNGLQAGTRKYALKLRSDTRLDHAGFLSWFDRFPARNPACKILEQRVIIKSIGTLHPRKCPSVANPRRFLFYPCDFMYFGLRLDVLNIWDIPLMTAQDANWFNQGSPRWCVRGMKNRLHSESHIWVSFLLNNGWTKVIQNWAEFDQELLRSSELSIVNNLILLDQNQFGYHCFKYPSSEGPCWGLQYLQNFTNWDWQVLYREYCDPNFKPPLFDPLQWHILKKDKGLSLLKYLSRWPEHAFRWLRDRLLGKKPWPWNY